MKSGKFHPPMRVELDSALLAPAGAFISDEP